MLKRLLITLAAFGVLSVHADEAQSQASASNNQPVQGVIFAGQTFDPWKMYIGNPTRWMQPTMDESAATRTPRNVKLDMSGDFNGTPIIDVEFLGKTSGQLVFQADEPVDLKAVSDAGGLLSMVLRVHEAPTEQIKLRMDCFFPCFGEVELTQILENLPTGEWVRVGIPLHCFETSGTMMERVNAPAVFITNGELKMNIGDLRIVEAMNASSVVQCMEES
jgi:beta-glucosidase